MEKLLGLIEPMKNMDFNDFVYDGSYVGYPFVVYDFEKALYDSPINDPNYVSNMISHGWWDTEKMINDIPKMTASEIGTCLTAIFRKERFVSGTIEKLLKSNVIFMLLEHLKRGCR